MTSDLYTSDASRGDRARTRAYHRDFWPGMAAYIVLLLVAIRWGGLDGSSGWRYAWALLPVLPAAWVVRAVIRHVNRIDEYQRQLLTRSLAIGFAVAMLASLTVGFLASAGLATPLAGWIVYSAGMLGWAGGSALTSKR